MSISKAQLRKILKNPDIREITPPHSPPPPRETVYLPGELIAEFSLPLPPSANRIWRNGVGRTKPRRSEDYEEFLAAVRGALSAFRPVSIPVRLDMAFYMATGDASNRIKALEDSLQELIYLDDKQIVEGRYRRCKCKRTEQRAHVKVFADG